MFYGSDGGGDRTAAVYTLLETVKPNGVDQHAYPPWIFETVESHPVGRTDDLLPWKFKAVAEDEIAS